MMANNSTKTKFKKLCKKLDITPIPYPQGMWSLEGVPDYLLIVNNRAIFIDIKHKYDRLRDTQIKFGNFIDTMYLYCLYDSTLIGKNAINYRKNQSPFYKWIEIDELESIINEINKL